MENFDQPLDVGMGSGQEQEGLRITQEVRLYWHQTSKWTMFLAILLFIVFGLVSLLGLLTAIAGGAMGILLGIFIVAIYGAFLFFPALYYYRFSTQMKEALSTEDTGLLDEAFLNFKRFYRYVGILLIVIFAAYLLFALIFGASLLSRGF